jgi:hypothetical protein
VEPAHSLSLAPGWRLWRAAALRGAGMPFAWLDAFAGEQPAASRAAVRRLLTEDRFVEALVWQNPTAAGNWVLRHAAALREGTELARRGTHDGLAARYAQRYCAKNDTIGAFGPVAWARFDPAASGVSWTGGGGIRRRSVHFESWALRALADAWARDERVRPFLPVRRHPTAGLDQDGRVRRAWRPAEELSPLAARILAAVADKSTVADLVATFGEPGEAEIWRLHEAQVLDVGFVVPLDDRPEQRLRGQVDQIADDTVRAELLARLDGLDAAREQVVAATGDPARLHEALRRLIALFAEATGADGVRSKNQAPIGRVPVYQDCRRDLDAVVGGDVLDRLRAPLGLLLRSARWLVAEVAEAVEDELRRRFAQLRRRDPDVRLSQLYLRAADVLSGSERTVVHDVVEDFQLRWGELLPSDVDGPVLLAADELESLAAGLFPERTSLWSAARFHSPDLLLARRPGGWQWVLGELHLAMNTLENRVFHTQSDDPDALNAAVAADVAAGRVVAMQPFDSPEVSPRTYPPLASHCPDYLYWSYGWDSGVPTGARCWPAAELRVWEEGGRLLVGPTGGGWAAPVVEALGEFLSALVVNRFQIRPPARHQPRVVLDDLVVCRESWRLPADELVSAPERVAELTDQLRALGLPRHVFAKTAAEPKPFYVDVESPLLVRNLARALRLLADRPESQRHVDISEMLPGPDELWTVDGADGLCTSELRAVVVDETPTTAPWLEDVHD